MKVFLINLDKDVAKLGMVTAQLKNAKVDYERVSGVYGNALPSVERKAAYSSFRWWCAVGRPIVAAEIGCALSHYSIYRRMIAENIPCAFIFEDDVNVEPKFNEVLQVVEGWLDVKRPQVILFSNHGQIDFSQMEPEYVSTYGVELYKTAYGFCTESYCLTLAAAKALLRKNFPMKTPCDHWGRWMRCGAIELYHVLPTTCIQKQEVFGSSTSQGRGLAVADYSFPKWLFHKGKRVIGKSIDTLLQLVGQ